jgi:two-component system LytT family response regulator
MNLRALIVDDEEFGRENLAYLLKQYCTEIDVVGMADSAAQARKLIVEEEPDVIFLDINMPGENGLSLMQSFENSDMQVVFVTAYDQYSLNAIKAGAFDYILKPIDIEELQQTVARLIKVFSERQARVRELEQYKQSFNSLKDSLTRRKQPEKINIPHSKGIKIVNINDIIRLTADNNYTDIYLQGAQKLVVSRTLKDFEEVLDPEIFFRIHKSHIINIEHLKEYINEYNGYVLMSDGAKIEISRRRSSDFMQFLAQAFKELKKS